MKLAALILALIVLGGLVYIRVAPSKPDRWQALSGETALGDLPRASGHVHRRETDAAPALLAQIDAIARATPRTSVLAGSPQTGMTTYVTRSRLFGFPDYTTVGLDGGVLEIFARQRFGSEDLGVNRARVAAWLSQL